MNAATETTVTILRGANTVRAIIPGWEFASFNGGAIEVYKVDGGLPSWVGYWNEIGAKMPDYIRPAVAALAAAA